LKHIKQLVEYNYSGYEMGYPDEHLAGKFQMRKWSFDMHCDLDKLMKTLKKSAMMPTRSRCWFFCNTSSSIQTTVVQSVVK
jgi:hypothetical protein